tara:strand:+ start:213 stop:1121 length:909 start_codon:yes stop_codon:yes gene_type:complete
MSYYKLNIAYHDKDITEYNYIENLYKNTLYIFPMCGLANQLQVIFSGIIYSRKHNMDYIIVPHLYTSLNAHFTDLFNNPEIKYQKSSLDKIKKLNLQLYTNQIRETHIQDRAKSYSNKKIKNLTNDIKHDENYGIIACISYESINDILPLYKTLKPSKDVLDKINSFYKQGDNIGIHIRHTDGPIKYTKENIVNIVNKIYTKYKNKYKFLICADNQDIKDSIINIMDENDVFYQKTNLTSAVDKMSVDRRNLNGMICATADLFALSYCKLLWGSGANSSFFRTALNMGNAVELNIENYTIYQ